MKMMDSVKKYARKASAQFRNGCIGVTGFAAANSAFAVGIDVAGVNTALETAEGSAHSVGTTVIGIVAGLTVIGIVIGLARKL